MTPRSITLIGRNNTAPSHMTDAQREQAEGRWVDENGQPWTVLRCARIFLGFALLFAAAWVAMWVTA